MRVRVREGEGEREREKERDRGRERERERERETEKYDINKYRNITLKNLQSRKSFTSGKKNEKIKRRVI